MMAVIGKIGKSASDTAPWCTGRPVAFKNREFGVFNEEYARGSVYNMN
jgi:hypothetical protein